MNITVRAVVLAVLLASVPLHAETHRFVPEQFYTTYSGAHPPALRIKPGDRVITKTIYCATWARCFSAPNLRRRSGL